MTPSFGLLSVSSAVGLVASVLSQCQVSTIGFEMLKKLIQFLFFLWIFGFIVILGISIEYSESEDLRQLQAESRRAENELKELEREAQR